MIEPIRGFLGDPSRETDEVLEMEGVVHEIEVEERFISVRIGMKLTYDEWALLGLSPRVGDAVRFELRNRLALSE